MMKPCMHAYHFTGDVLRDGRPIPPVGQTLVHDGPLVLCAQGLHASEHPFDALAYAPGPRLHRVTLGGRVRHDTDKVVASERTIRATIDATDLLRRFARQCATDVLHLWDAPDVVRQYLETGDESIRTDAHSAAHSAAWDTGKLSNVSSFAARTAARTAAGAAAGAAEPDAVWFAARKATRDATNATYWAAEAAAAGDTARDAQRDRFAQMVNDAFATREGHA